MGELSNERIEEIDELRECDSLSLVVIEALDDLLADREELRRRIAELEAFVKRVAREFGPSSADTHWELGDRARAILRGEQQL